MTEGWRRSAFRRQVRGLPATAVLIGLIVVAALASFVAPGSRGVLVIGSAPVFDLQVWRPFTSALVTGSLVGAALTGLFLWFLGRAMEPDLGTVGFAGLYVVSGLGAAAAVTWLGPLVSFGGATGALFGLLGAQAAAKLKAREDIRGDLVLVAILLAYAFFVGGGDWTADLGGLVAGTAAGAVGAWAPWRLRMKRLRVGLVAIGAVALFACGVAWLT